MNNNEKPPANGSPKPLELELAAPNIAFEEVGRWLSRQASNGVLWIDALGSIAYSNLPAEQLFDRGLLVGRSLQDLAVSINVLERIRSALTQQGPGATVEFRVRASTGERTIEGQVTRWREGFALFLSDPSVQQELIEELMQLASWPELNPSPLLEFGLPELDVRYSNASGHGLIDAAREALRTVVPDDTPKHHRLPDLLFTHLNQTYRAVVHAVPEWGCIRLYLRDETAEAKALAALDESRAKLERRVQTRTAQLAHEVEVRRRAERQAIDAYHAKSAFLASMSHELRTPLNAILGYTELLQDDEIDADKRRDLARVANAGQHLLDLISSILDLAKVESGKMEIVYQPVDLAALIGTVIDTVRPLAEQKNVSVSHSIAALPSLTTDPLRVRQVLLNLVGNAVKFISSGQVRVQVELVDGRVHIAVIDTGPGIESNNLDRIFEPFQQESTATEREHGGTGLGLSICREIAKLLHGTLTVQSTLGTGSVFLFTLPVGPPTLQE